MFIGNRSICKGCKHNGENNNSRWRPYNLGRAYWLIYRLYFVLSGILNQLLYNEIYTCMSLVVAWTNRVGWIHGSRAKQNSRRNLSQGKRAWLFECSYWIVFIDGCFLLSLQVKTLCLGLSFSNFFIEDLLPMAIQLKTVYYINRIWTLPTPEHCIFAIQKMLREFLSAWTKIFWLLENTYQTVSWISVFQNTSSNLWKKAKTYKYII